MEQQNGKKLNSEWMKRQAKRMKKETGLSHMQCLDRLAQQHGFSNWTAFLAATQQGRN